MSQWLAEILADRIASGKWEKGAHVKLRPDILVSHDISFPMAIKAFKSMGSKKVMNPERIFILQDHLQPAKDRKSADLPVAARRFANEHGITNFFNIGDAGILTVALDELTQLRPGMRIAGTDTQMPTYGAFGIISLNIGPLDLAHAMTKGTFWFEPPKTISIRLSGKLEPYVVGRDAGFWLLKKIGLDGGLGKFFLLEGDVVDSFEVCNRRQLCNLTVETGAAGAFMKADKVVAEHLGLSFDDLPRCPTLECDSQMEFNLAGIEPQVAIPGDAGDVLPVSDIDPVNVDAVFIGSCSGGSIEDLKALDAVLEGNEIHRNVRLIVIPQSAGTFRKAEHLGIIGRIAAKGAFIAGPGCGPCMGAHLGVLGKDEVCVSTSPRNYSGRMGSRLARIYLANAWVAAASAVTGNIKHPADLLG